MMLPVSAAVRLVGNQPERGRMLYPFKSRRLPTRSVFFVPIFVSIFVLLSLHLLLYARDQ